MNSQGRLHGKRHRYSLGFSITLVGLHGLFILANTMFLELMLRRGVAELTNDIYIDSLAGLSLLYLWSLLRRHKRNAWIVTIGIYIFTLGANASRALTIHDINAGTLIFIATHLLLPAVILLPLAYFRNDFTVRSDVRGFAQAVRISIILLAVTFAYGVSGFMVLDTHDFHEEISIAAAVQRTVDQFDLTTTHSLAPYTKRAKAFMDSLSITSTGTLVFVFLSFFQPLRARYAHNKKAREDAELLLERSPGDSDDYFKLWPDDKAYIFTDKMNAALAYRVERGVALVVGDPFGNPHASSQALSKFEEMCYTNDWLPVLVNSASEQQDVYIRHGFANQLIGQTARVNTNEFLKVGSKNKYFRNIRNRFDKQGYSIEYIHPPHSAALLQRLRVISDNWLQRPGRAERGFMMGYFNDDYLQQCSLVVARDNAGTIQGFLNKVPTFGVSETTYDMLRSAETALGNVNDYLLMSFIEIAALNKYEYVSLGLSPLAGIDDANSTSVIDVAMKLIYRGGDRFYSFDGLRKFKDKYNPEWSDRYIVYKKGVPGFTRSIRALTRAMNHAPKKLL